MNNNDFSKTILVPYDFTVKADAAIKHANSFAKKLSKTVTLLHVIADYDEKTETLARLKAIAANNQKITDITTEYCTSTGTIYDQIGQAADILDAAFVVMATHGINGVQKVFGSKALKVITKSHKPYIVVQDEPADQLYKQIIVPMSYQPECKQPLFHIMNIAKLFNATCHIIADKSSDPHHLNNIKNNVAYAESFLKENNIDFHTVAPEVSAGDFNQAVLRYAKHKHAGLITLITQQNISLFEFLMQPAEQYFIANQEKIPVMCIHPDYNSIKYGSVFAN
ncbi:MAG: universal stress protein [Bacteroidia bacterium]|nr:universal stress protein [Bacteroidia bacterium]HQU99928.1 universal stress protein [Bacteroidia bacterium]